MDLEDPEYAGMKIRRFIQHHPLNSTYIECDAEFASNYDVNDEYMLERMLQSKDKKKYMFQARVHEKKLFSFEFAIGGVRFDKRETTETSYGKDHTFVWQNIGPTGTPSMMQTQRWLNGKKGMQCNFQTCCTQNELSESHNG